MMKECDCQGLDKGSAGKSYTWGCSYSVYNYSRCKFARPRSEPRKFAMTALKKLLPTEIKMENLCHNLADEVALFHKQMAPECFKNMLCDGGDGCRIGRRERERPYGGVTTVVDFCAHSHQDSNMIKVYLEHTVPGRGAIP